MDKLKIKPRRTVSTERARDIFKKIFKNIGFDKIDKFGNLYHANHDYTAKLIFFRNDFEFDYGYVMTIIENSDHCSHIVFGVSRDCTNVWSALLRFMINFDNSSKLYKYSIENLNLSPSSKKNDLQDIKVVEIIISEIRKAFLK